MEGRPLEKGGAPFRSLLESAAEAIIIVNRDGLIVLANDRAEKLFGYSRREMQGQCVELLVPERLRDLHVGHRRHYLEDPRNRPMGVGLDLTGRRSDGGEFPAEISLSHVGTDKELLIMASVADISARRQMEAALRENEMQCRSLIDAVLDSSTGGIIIRDAKGGIVCFNKAMEEFFDIRREEVLGRDMLLVAGEMMKDAIEPTVPFLGSISFSHDVEGSGNFLELHVSPAGNRRERWLEYRSEPILSGLYGGGLIDHYFDVTELKLAQEARMHLMEERIRELESTLHALEQIASTPKAGVTACLLGIGPLRESAPAVFDALEETYDGLMDQALERRMYRVEDKLSEALADMAQRLCFLKAAPRDVVDLHSAVLKRKSLSVPPSRMRGYLDEGHFFLVELMGHLAAGYRNQVFRGPDADRQGECKTTEEGD